MLKIGLSGCRGRMGRAITELAAGREDLVIVAGFDILTDGQGSYPVYADPFEYGGEMDVCLDFSTATALDHLLEYCVPKHIPLLVATTGHNEAQLEKLKKASEKIPVFKSANMSLGIAVLSDLVRRAARVLGEDYDVEILERHHNQKLDAPSGTALSLARDVQSQLPQLTELVYNRHDRREKRPKNEIGMHAMRGGTIVGEHEVMFAGTNEVISLQHSAQSREVFAVGALRAAGFLAQQKPGMYDMRDLVAAIQ